MVAKTVAKASAKRVGRKLVRTALARTRTLPIQRSIDIAAPIELAWREWDECGLVAEDAEILEERPEESFAWHSVDGSDCSGLVTFHPLSARLTRVELHLDVIPGGVADALRLITRIADRRADTELRRFKAHVETLDPDEYPTEED